MRPALLRLAVMTLIGAMVCTAAEAQSDTAANSRLFEVAMRAAASADYVTAIRLLSALSAETHEQRVDLELGRVLFLSGDYRHAKQVFLRVYRGPLPYPVRRAVDVFLTDIDQRLGYLRPSVGLVVDSNPTGAARSGVYDIFGAPLSYETTARSAMGVSYRIDGLAPIGRDGDRQWQIAGSMDGRWFQRRASRHEGADLGLRVANLGSRTYATVGWRGTRAESQRTSSPYLSVQRRLIVRPDREIDLAAAVEVNRFPGQASLKGETVRGSVGFVGDIGRSVSLRVASGAAWSTIDDGQWPKSTVFGQVGFARSLPRLNLNLLGTASAYRTGYGASDVFFGKLRRDTSGRLDLAAYQARPVFGLFPGVTASFESRRSNIDFYGYRRAGFNVDFRRRF